VDCGATTAIPGSGIRRIREPRTIHERSTTFVLDGLIETGKTTADDDRWRYGETL
jgi:hypothetical protein